MTGGRCRGRARPLLDRLFPPPTHEAPDDVFFALTGMLPARPAIGAGVAPRLLRRHRRHTRVRERGDLARADVTRADRHARGTDVRNGAAADLCEAV